MVIANFGSGPEGGGGGGVIAPLPGPPPVLPLSDMPNNHYNTLSSPFNTETVNHVQFMLGPLHWTISLFCKGNNKMLG